MFGVIASILIAVVSLFVPGVLLSFVLLRKTELHPFEIVFVGIIFGLIAAPTMTWIESYLDSYIHFFSYSLELFLLNCVILTIIGIVLAFREGMLRDFISWCNELLGGVANPESAVSRQLASVRVGLSKYERGKEVITRHEEEERALKSRQQAELTSSTFKADEKQIMIYNHKEALVRLMKSHLSEEKSLAESVEGSKYQNPNPSNKPHWIIWAVLLVLILLTFYTRIANIGIAPKFFEFDPYFDMIDSHYILTYGHQLLLDPSAWPVVAAGTNHRIEPIVPYLESFWYSLVNALKFHYSTFSTNLMSYIGSIYPPITAALLVFVVFVLLYHEYDANIGLIGAGLAATMPTLISTFIAGEQLVEPWGIMTLFFFIMAYMLAIRNMKNKRLAILAGIAFVSTFLGAHYYTVTTGVLALYIVLQGIMEVIRGHDLTDFYKMNAIVLIIIAIFVGLFLPYQSDLQNRVPSLLGIPFTLAAPLFALIGVFVFDYLLKFILPRLKTSNITTLAPLGLIALVIIGTLAFLTSAVLASTVTSVLVIILAPIWIFAFLMLLLLFTKKLEARPETLWRAAILIILLGIVVAGVFLTPLRHSFNSYIDLSARFTTPSIPLFMTVQEYEPTGLSYNFASGGFGGIGAPGILFIVCIASFFIILLSILYRKSQTGVLYLSIAAPLMTAGLIEVKYLPHFGVAYIMLFCILIGEILYLAESKWKLSEYAKQVRLSPAVYQNAPVVAYLLLLIGAYFIFGIIACIGFILFAVYQFFIKNNKNRAYIPVIVLSVLLIVPALFLPMFTVGMSYAAVGVVKGAAVMASTSNVTTACNTMSANGNDFGDSVYCNLIPQYWLNAMTWISNNVGPTAPRVLAWWDYGDWINWFGHSNAVLRGDNSVPKEDYATAAQYVMGPQFNSTPASLHNFMNTNQSEYVLFDQDLISKWGALDFLACVNDNQTSLQYAVQQGKLSNPQQPYALGTSQCEQQHDPQYAAFPLSVLQGTSSSSSINNYCSLTSSNAVYVNTFLITGSSLSNTSACTELPYQNTAQVQAGVLSMYYTNGTKMNAYIQESQYLGVQDLNGVPYVLFLVVYTPNAANGVITNAPSQFYDSNYYRGFFTGDLPGFVQVYPNATQTGTNFVNFSDPIRIYKVLNYTGGAPTVPPKPSWITNNDVMP